MDRRLPIFRLMKRFMAFVLGIAGVAVAVRGLAEGEPENLVKVTKERIPMDERLRLLCGSREMVAGPHVEAEVDVYVNAIVIDYRRENAERFEYPVGAVFVKKKYPSLGAEAPDLATKMVKVRNEGKVSDWEFSMYRLPGGEVVQPAGKVSCASCHERYEERGFISRESEAALREFLKG